jgi:hypothetical protein
MDAKERLSVVEEELASTTATLESARASHQVTIVTPAS